MSTLAQILRSRWFAACLLVGLGILLLLTGLSIGSRTLKLQENEDNPATAAMPVPVVSMEKLFGLENWPKALVDPATTNAFATTYFFPKTAPVVTPTTRRVDVTYQGFYQTTEGPRHAMLRVGDTLVGVPVGGVVVTNLYVAEAEFKTVTLTNSAKQTNVLAVNTKKELEVPLK